MDYGNSVDAFPGRTTAGIFKEPIPIHAHCWHHRLGNYRHCKSLCFCPSGCLDSFYRHGHDLCPGSPDFPLPGRRPDRLFFITVQMSWLVFAIAIPFFLIEPTSLPLSVGILAGLMWLPFSWIIQHWIGTFHAFARTALVAIAWFAFPDQRFVIIPFIIVVIYLITIYVLIKRPRPK
jgi:hypothetical protein